MRPGNGTQQRAAEAGHPDQIEDRSLARRDEAKQRWRERSRQNAGGVNGLALNAAGKQADREGHDRGDAQRRSEIGVEREKSRQDQQDRHRRGGLANAFEHHGPF